MIFGDLFYIGNIFVFDDFYFVYSMVVGLVLC